MNYLFFIQIVTTYLASYLSQNINLYDFEVIQAFGRISYNRPLPTSQLFFPNSADYADEYHLRSLHNLTITQPFFSHPNDTGSHENFEKTDPSFLGDSSLPRFLHVTFHGFAKIASWILEPAINIIIITLKVLVVLGTPAAAALALREQRERDFHKLETECFSSVVPCSVLTSSTVDYYSWSAARLEARLEKSKDKRQAQKALIKQLDLCGKALEAENKDLRTSKNQLELDIKERDDEIKRTKEELEAQCKEVQEATGKLKEDLKMARGNISSLLATIQSNSRELHMHRERSSTQRQAGTSAQHYMGPRPYQPAPMQFLPAQRGMQLPPGQSPFAHPPLQTPGFPPNRTSGFMGNNPPQGWGRGAGAGGGAS